PPIPETPGAVEYGFRPLGLLMIPLGLLAAAIVFVVGRAYGSNDVAGAGGAADAAFGDLQLPGSAVVPADVATYRVPDSRLAEMATVEFVPPRGLEPWQAGVLLRERIDDRSVTAWFSEMIATGAMEITEDGSDVRLRRGDNTARLNAVDQGHINGLFGVDDEVELGKYDPAFTSTWNSIKREQQSFVRTAGWWSRGGPGGAPSAVLVTLAITAGVLVTAAAVGVFFVSSSSAVWRVIASPLLALVIGFIVPLVAATIAYWPMFASRTATGSALALRSESFRRFLAASEGRHVEWAWELGLLREYSAWAVALGAADTWSRAIESSAIPEPQAALALAGPLLVHSAGSSFQSTHTAPSSSGGGGGGVGGGGGGGGGSSGSW
ncbi:MAG: hypothetical protein WBP59_13305, partial [Ilumatobacteraceae bacterium]